MQASIACRHEHYSSRTFLWAHAYAFVTVLASRHAGEHELPPYVS